MAVNRKYAGLPDVDVSARDIFETPDLADDVSTLPTSASSRPTSPGAHDDADAYADDVEGITRPRIRPSQARGKFSSAQIDASDVDFSDCVSSKRKSYKATSRRRKAQRAPQQQDGIFGDVGMSDEDVLDDDDSEGEETVGKKMARIKREMEELRIMVEEEKRAKDEERQTGTRPDEDYGDEDEEGWERLGEALEGLMTIRGRTGGAEAELARKLATATVGLPPTSPISPDDGKDPQSPGKERGEHDPDKFAGVPTTTSYTVSYSPHFRRTHTLAKVADFDSRISLLERLLGISSTSSLSSVSTHHAIIPAIDTLTQQLTLLTSTSASSLDAVNRRVKALAQDAEKLTEARKAAKVAAEEARRAAAAAGPDEDPSIAVAAAAATGGIPSALDGEKEAKVNAIYGTLPTIEGLAPLLPAVLDRLRGLRSIHAEAARSVSALESLERRQEEMQEEIEKWKEALGNAERAVKVNEKVIGGNMKKVEEWVATLEDKVKRLK